MTRPHETHHDDCGCLSERHQQQLADANAAIKRLTRERDEMARYLNEWQSGTHDFACESELDDATKCMTPCGCAYRRLALAAAEARERELREALDHLLREWMAWQPGLTGVARTRAERTLSRSPGGSEALRALLMQFGCEVLTCSVPVSVADLDAIVARLLGPQAAEEGGVE